MIQRNRKCKTIISGTFEYFALRRYYVNPRTSVEKLNRFLPMQEQRE